jgi:5-methylcytosine-specific restriction endonuclease McrA
MNQARLLLQIAHHDSTFTVVIHQGRRCLRGRCIYCNTALLLEMDGQRISAATVEHLRPRHHGGDSSLQNLAIACLGCNQSKGLRIDRRRRGDPRAEEVIAAALERRRERWREGAPLDMGQEEG